MRGRSQKQSRLPSQTLAQRAENESLKKQLEGARAENESKQLEGARAENESLKKQREGALAEGKRSAEEVFLERKRRIRLEGEVAWWEQKAFDAGVAREKRRGGWRSGWWP